LTHLAAHPAFQVRDLFQRFLPEELRPKTLGSNFKPEALLALSGNAAVGEKVFFREAVQCSQCHHLHGKGRDFGPDLSRIGRKYSRAQLLEQVLNPSKTIDPAYVTYAVETKEDVTYTGFLLKRTPAELLLKDANLNQTRISATAVKKVQPLQLSAMPEGLLQNLSAQDAADLLEFLSSLR
jgi:putative heme-binding domain-containing protein